MHKVQDGEGYSFSPTIIKPNVDGLCFLSDKKFYIIKDGCPVSPMDMFIRSGKLPYEWLEEVTEDVALLNPSKTILYGFTNDEVKSFFRRSNEVLNIPLPHETDVTITS